MSNSAIKAMFRKVISCDVKCRECGCKNCDRAPADASSNEDEELCWNCMEACCGFHRPLDAEGVGIGGCVTPLFWCRTCDAEIYDDLGDEDRKFYARSEHLVAEHGWIARRSTWPVPPQGVIASAFREVKGSKVLCRTCDCTRCNEAECRSPEARCDHCMDETEGVHYTLDRRGNRAGTDGTPAFVCVICDETINDASFKARSEHVLRRHLAQPTAEVAARIAPMFREMTDSGVPCSECDCLSCDRAAADNDSYCNHCMNGVGAHHMLDHNGDPFADEVEPVFACLVCGKHIYDADNGEDELSLARLAHMIKRHDGWVSEDPRQVETCTVCMKCGYHGDKLAHRWECEIVEVDEADLTSSDMSE